MAEKLKKTLLEEKARLETQLNEIATRNPAIKGDWAAMPATATDQSDTLDEKAQGVTNWEERRAVEQNLELRLKEINETLARLDRGNYGICANCSAVIDARRLNAMPSVQLCFDCASSKSNLT